MENRQINKTRGGYGLLLDQRSECRFDDFHVSVSLDRSWDGSFLGVVQAEGFEFPFTARCCGGNVWLWFEKRLGPAELIFLKLEEDIRWAARSALKSMAA
ncbi:MAG: hypothetical protein GXP49_01375 [Deltaproteobacteria bacterium]|nr:hypothetical protein [Deltaproteobacteria bacterium]